MGDLDETMIWAGWVMPHFHQNAPFNMTIMLTKHLLKNQLCEANHSFLVIYVNYNSLKRPVLSVKVMNVLLP